MIISYGGYNTYFGKSVLDLNPLGATSTSVAPVTSAGNTGNTGGRGISAQFGVVYATYIGVGGAGLTIIPLTVS